MMNHFLSRMRAVWHPERYHGWGKETSFFEGWYVKVVDPTESHAYAIIPGVSMDANGRKHSFIQLLDGVHAQSGYFDFPFEAFQANADRFEVSIGKNTFSAESVSIDLPDFQAELTFGDIVPWPRTMGIPGVMGIFTFVPFMQCYHGVVSMDHQISGHIHTSKNGTISMDGGRGYMEKDWGSSFPKSWIWMQSNHFGRDFPVSFMFSLAHIPWMGSYFNGFLCGLWLDGQLWRFATYTGARVRGESAGNSATIEIKQGNVVLKIHAVRDDGGDLLAPVKGSMTGKVNESMQSHIDLELYKNGKCEFSGSGKLAGMEFSGDIASLLHPR